MINENNRVTIVGQVGVIEFSHSFKGENFSEILSGYNGYAL